MIRAGSYDNTMEFMKKRTLADCPTPTDKASRRDEGDVHAVEFTNSVEKKVNATMRRAGPSQKVSGMWRCAEAKPRAV